MTYQKSSIQILKLKNQTYLPFQLHQLPKWFNTSTTNYFSHKGYCYISLTDIKYKICWLKNYTQSSAMILVVW